MQCNIDCYALQKHIEKDLLPARIIVPTDHSKLNFNGGFMYVKNYCIQIHALY